MNVAKIPILLVVLWSLFTAIPSYAATSSASIPSAATVSEDNSNGNSTPIGNTSEAVYSIDASLSNPTINPGDILEIAVYLSGYGIPDKYKLTVIWSYPKVIEEKEGNITFLDGYEISGGNVMVRFKTVPLGVGNSSASFAAWVVPSNAIFATVPPFVQPDFPEKIGIRMVMGEFNWGGNPPILIELKTSTNAAAGDYQVGLTFTYGNETNPKQDSKFVEFHIRSMWWGYPRENWLFGASVFGGATAWLALIIGARAAICRRSRPGSEEEKPKRRPKHSS